MGHEPGSYRCMWYLYTSMYRFCFIALAELAKYNNTPDLMRVEQLWTEWLFPIDQLALTLRLSSLSNNTEGCPLLICCADIMEVMYIMQVPPRDNDQQEIYAS